MDFFVEEFENSESEKMRSILQKFTQYKDDLDNRGSAYGAVFRVILLLMFLYTFVGGAPPWLELTYSCPLKKT